MGNLFVPLDVEKADDVHVVRQLHDSHWPNHFAGICSIQKLGALASYSSCTFPLCNCSHSTQNSPMGFGGELWIFMRVLEAVPEISIEFWKWTHI